MAEYKYNSYVISNLAKSLRVWADNDDSYILLEWMNANKLLYEHLWDFKKKSDEFAKAVNYAKQRISVRLHKRLAENKINASYYHRIIRMYDTGLERKENEDKELEYQLKAKYETKDTQGAVTVNVTSFKDVEIEKKTKKCKDD
jgi:hypothetical protein